MLRNRKQQSSSSSPLEQMLAAKELQSGPEVVVEEEASIDSTVEKQWPAAAYIPPPLVPQRVILGVGLVFFLLAVLWPPLILLVAYIASKLIPYSFRVNDSAAARRQLFQRFKDDDEIPDAIRQAPDHIHLEESYWTNDRGMVLGTVIMIPKNVPIRAVACFCHGYLDNVSFMKRVENMRLLERGIAFCAIEYEGHGKSDGPLGLIRDWERLVDDVTTYYQQTCAKRFHNVPAFLVGESMGGAVAYSVYNRIPEVFRGVVFVCPMCKINEHMLPPAWVIQLLMWLIGPTGTSSWLGYLPIAPSSNLKDVCTKMPEKRELLSRCPSEFDRNPRLATARELIQVTQRISNGLPDFDAPFLVLHGKADLVTDPGLSQSLYDEAKSKDKSIQLYEGMWHSLLAGEPEENTQRIFGDVCDWILARA